MTSVSRAAQESRPADDPGVARVREDGPATAPLFDNYLAPDRPHAGA